MVFQTKGCILTARRRENLRSRLRLQNVARQESIAACLGGKTGLDPLLDRNPSMWRDSDSAWRWAAWARAKCYC